MKIYASSAEIAANLWDDAAERSTVFARELSQFLDAGYERVGNYLIPPSK